MCVRVCVCVVFCMRGFDEDFKTHVKLNKSDFFGKLIIRQSENLRIQIARFSVWVLGVSPKLSEPPHTEH